MFNEQELAQAFAEGLEMNASYEPSPEYYSEIFGVLYEEYKACETRPSIPEAWWPLANCFDADDSGELYRSTDLRTTFSLTLLRRGLHKRGVNINHHFSGGVHAVMLHTAASVGTLYPKGWQKLIGTLGITPEYFENLTTESESAFYKKAHAANAILIMLGELPQHTLSQDGFTHMMGVFAAESINAEDTTGLGSIPGLADVLIRRANQGTLNAGHMASAMTITMVTKQNHQHPSLAFLPHLEKTAAAALSSLRDFGDFLETTELAYETAKAKAVTKRWQAAAALPSPEELTPAHANLSMLERSDARLPWIGLITACCQHLEGAGSAAAWDSLENPDATVWVYTHHQRIIAQAYVWRTQQEGRTVIVLDNIEAGPVKNNAGLMREVQEAFVSSLKGLLKPGDLGLIGQGYAAEEGDLAALFGLPATTLKAEGLTAPSLYTDAKKSWKVEG